MLRSDLGAMPGKSETVSIQDTYQWYGCNHGCNDGNDDVVDVLLVIILGLGY